MPLYNGIDDLHIQQATLDTTAQLCQNNTEILMPESHFRSIHWIAPASAHCKSSHFD